VNLNSTHPLALDPLISLRTLLNQSLDCVDISRWTGDRSSAPFISSQLHLLHTLIHEARTTLKGPTLEPPPPDWPSYTPDAESFSPELPPSLALTLTISEASLLLTTRILVPADEPPDLRSRFTTAFLGPQPPTHDEEGKVYVLGERKVRVKEKIRVESADPCLIAVGAKLAALEHGVGIARSSLAIVMGVELEDIDS
jgi:hypothetical protein